MDVIPIIAREFDDFETEADRFLAGETRRIEFIGFRLKQGVYGQRQPGVKMIRVKLPIGGITPDQLEAFGDVIRAPSAAEKGAHHDAPDRAAPPRAAASTLREALRVHLRQSGLSSREGCGNTVRNVTGDPFAGPPRGRDLRPDAVGLRLRPRLRAPPADPADAAEDQDRLRGRVATTAR